MLNCKAFMVSHGQLFMLHTLLPQPDGSFIHLLDKCSLVRVREQAWGSELRFMMNNTDTSAFRVYSLVKVGVY